MNEDDMKNNKEEKRKEVLKDKSESALAFGAIFGGVAGVILLFESSLHTTANESTAPFSLTKGSPTRFIFSYVFAVKYFSMVTIPFISYIYIISKILIKIKWADLTPPITLLLFFY